MLKIFQHFSAAHAQQFGAGAHPFDKLDSLREIGIQLFGMLRIEIRKRRATAQNRAVLQKDAAPHGSAEVVDADLMHVACGRSADS